MSTRRRPSLDHRPRLSHHCDIDDFAPLSPRALRGQSMISPSRPTARDALKTNSDVADLAAFLRGTGPPEPITVRSPTFDDDLPPITPKRAGFLKVKLSTLRKNQSRPELRGVRSNKSSTATSSEATPLSPQPSLSSASLRSSLKQDEFSQQLKMGSLTKKVLPNGVSYYAIGTSEESSELKLPVSASSFGTFHIGSQVDLANSTSEAQPKSARLEPRSARADPRPRSATYSDDGRRLTLTEALAQGPGLTTTERNAARRAAAKKTDSASDSNSISTESDAEDRPPDQSRPRRPRNKSSPNSSPALTESLKHVTESPELPSRSSSRGHGGEHIETDGTQPNSGWSQSSQLPSLIQTPATTQSPLLVSSLSADALSSRSRHASLKPPMTPPSARSDALPPRVFSPADFARSSSRSSVNGSKRAVSNASSPSPRLTSPARRPLDSLDLIASEAPRLPSTPPPSSDALFSSKKSLFSTALTSPSRKAPQSPPSLQRQLSSRSRPRTAPERGREREASVASANRVSKPSAANRSPISPRSEFDLVLNDQVPITPRTVIAFTRAASEDLAESKVSTESSFRQTVTAPSSPTLEALDVDGSAPSDSAGPTVDVTVLPVETTRNCKRSGVCMSNVDMRSLKLPMLDLADASSLFTADNADCVSLAQSVRSWKDAASVITGKETESEDDAEQEVLATVDEATTIGHSTLRGSNTRPSTSVRSALGLDIGDRFAEVDQPLLADENEENGSLDEFSHPTQLWKALVETRKAAKLSESTCKLERARCCQMLKRCMAMLELQRRQLRAAEAAQLSMSVSGSPSERLASDEQRLTSLIADLLDFIGRPRSNKVSVTRTALPRDSSELFKPPQEEADTDAIVLRVRKGAPRASGIARPVKLVRSHSLQGAERPSITANHARHSSLSFISQVPLGSPLRRERHLADEGDMRPSAVSEAALYARSVASFS